MDMILRKTFSYLPKQGGYEAKAVCVIFLLGTYSPILTVYYVTIYFFILLFHTVRQKAYEGEKRHRMANNNKITDTINMFQ